MRHELEPERRPITVPPLLVRAGEDPPQGTDARRRRRRGRAGGRSPWPPSRRRSLALATFSPSSPDRVDDQRLPDRRGAREDKPAAPRALARARSSRGPSRDRVICARGHRRLPGHNARLSPTLLPQFCKSKIAIILIYGTAINKRRYGATDIARQCSSECFGRSRRRNASDGAGENPI